jgi:hypothetical protein
MPEVPEALARQKTAEAPPERWPTAVPQPARRRAAERPLVRRSVNWAI